MVEFEELCPKCGKRGTETEVDPNTGQVYVVCSNTACHSLLAIGWF